MNYYYIRGIVICCLNKAVKRIYTVISSNLNLLTSKLQEKFLSLNYNLFCLASAFCSCILDNQPYSINTNREARPVCDFLYHKFIGLYYIDVILYLREFESHFCHQFLWLIT